MGARVHFRYHIDQGNVDEGARNEGTQSSVLHRPQKDAQAHAEPANDRRADVPVESLSKGHSRTENNGKITKLVGEFMEKDGYGCADAWMREETQNRLRLSRTSMETIHKTTYPLQCHSPQRQCQWLVHRRDCATNHHRVPSAQG